MSANYRDINYEQESEKILNFVQNFKAAVEDAPRHRTAAREAEPSPKYIQLLQNIADRSLKAIVVDLDDLHKVRIHAGCFFPVFLRVCGSTDACYLSLRASSWPTSLSAVSTFAVLVAEVRAFLP